MVDENIVGIDPHNTRGIAQQFLQQFRVKSIPRNAQVLEFMRLDQSSGAIVLEGDRTRYIDAKVSANKREKNGEIGFTDQQSLKKEVTFIRMRQRESNRN